MRVLAIFLILLLFLLVNTATAATKKPPPQPKSQTTLPSQVSPVFVKKKNSVQITFSQLGNIKKISYMLTYEGNGQDRGVMGSVVPKSKNPVTKNIYLGTCSSGVCTAYRKIKNAILQVTTQPKKGKAITKTYKIKV